MRTRWYGLAALGGGLILLNGQIASANTPSDSLASAASTSGRAAAHRLALTLRQEDDHVVVAAGTLDDGKALSPLARISIDDAVAAAHAAVPGATAVDIGEVDLEEVAVVLVFNVDVGDKDVKVDADTGEVRATDRDD